MDERKGRGPSTTEPGSVVPLPTRGARKEERVGDGEVGADANDYQAGCNRPIQVTGRGKPRFDTANRKTFLEWFAATCNAKLAARQAGVAYSTVYRTRMLDPRFAEGWDRALEQGYARLEAKLLEMQFEAAVGEAVAFDGGFDPPSPAAAEDKADEGEGRFGAGPSTAQGAVPLPTASRQGGTDWFDAPDPKLVDPEMAMKLLQQHAAQVARIRGVPLAVPGRGRSNRALPSYERPRVASDAEVRAALARSLRAFGVRVAADDMRGDDHAQPSCAAPPPAEHARTLRGTDEHGHEEAPPPSSGRSPSPAKAGADE